MFIFFYALFYAHGGLFKPDIGRCPLAAQYFSLRGFMALF
jgi:hypothetical protein